MTRPNSGHSDLQFGPRRSLPSGAIPLPDFIADNWKWAVGAVIGVVVFAVVIGVYMAVGGRTETRSATLLQKAVSQMEAGYSSGSDPNKLEEGIRLMQEVINRYPKSAAAAEATLRLGTHYYTLGKYADARTAYTAYLEKNPKGRVAFSAGLGLGDAYLAEHNYEKAIETYTRLVEQFAQDPLAPEAQLHLAAALRGANRATEGSAIYEKIVATYPNTGWAQRAQSELYRSGLSAR
ncbi:MAG: hypothetical protein C3F12_00140 [Candidatus Methylomirabilota bacterium]|nr:tetratricopeptide repeat protein [candidate division NC10 bacterium]PWB48945.1 MAG: hypothetical protein C3F12_00140 [candidate division NC10 bacterium]